MANVIIFLILVQSFIMLTNLKKTGNSFGVILNKTILSKAGFANNEEVLIEAKENAIIISPATKHRPVNKDLSTWRKQIKTAIKNGDKPEKSVWGNSITETEEKDWT